MASRTGRIPYLLAGLLLSVGVGLLTYGIMYLSLRSNYLGPLSESIPSSFDPAYATYIRRYDELMFLCLSFAFGVGFLAMSLSSFLIIARTKPSDEGKFPSPEV